MTQPPRKPFPRYLALLLGLFILFLAWSGRQAATHGSRITDTDYYSKGLKYNTTLVEKRAVEVLGWHLQTDLTGRRLTFRLTDKTGQAVSQAKGKLFLAGDQAHAIVLQEAAGGGFHWQIPASLSGSVKLEIDFEKAGARLHRQLLINL